MSIDKIKLISSFKNNPALSASGFIILLLFVGLFVRFEQLEVNINQLSDLKKDLNNLQKNIANSGQLDRQLSEIISLSAKLEQEAIRPAELARNLQYFYTLEALNEVKLIDVRQQNVSIPAGGAAANPLAPITFSVNVAGEYEKLLKFLREIETTFLGGKVLSASISPGSALPNQNPDKSRLLNMIVQTVALTK